MNMHKFSSLLAIALCFIGLASSVSATSITNWIHIGDPGNLEDTILAKDGTSGYGAVDYSFRISEHEITNAQYTEFLNAVAVTDTNSLYWGVMNSHLWGGITRSGSSGNYYYAVKPNMGNRPVNYVSWFDAARYTNWLHNGQPTTGVQDSTTTEDGAYTFIGLETVSPRRPDALYFLPNEHEWHKAAFYEPGAVTHDGDEWYQFTTRSDFHPTPALVDTNGIVTNPGINVINYDDGAIWNGTGTIGNVTNVGDTGSQSYYGVKDMGGNVFEWVEADPTKPDPFEAGLYVVRGGSFANTAGHVRSNERNNGPILDEFGNVIPEAGHIHNVASRFNGFRIATLTIPEPSSVILVSLAAFLFPLSAGRFK